jgi:hypothetical protein
LAAEGERCGAGLRGGVRVRGPRGERMAAAGVKMAGSARGLASCWMAHVRAATPASMSASRKCSVKPWFDGSATDSSADAAGEQVGSSSGNRLEQVLHEFRIQKATPDWLPLMPERSFWMPPEEPVLEEAPAAAALEPATEGELFSMIMPSGWPAPAPVGGERSLSHSWCRSLVIRRF